MNPFIETITSPKAEVRNRSFESLSSGLSSHKLLAGCSDLEQFRHQTTNLYEKVRALFFLSQLYKHSLCETNEIPEIGYLPPAAMKALLAREFENSIQSFLQAGSQSGMNHSIASALGSAYQQLGFQTLADQVKKSVRSIRGNQWMFRTGHANDHPLRIDSTLLKREQTSYPVLREQTPVRMDLTHSCWSDVFFLGMDNPEGAKVINISVDLAVRGQHETPEPPISAYFRIIDRPVIRLVSIDLETQADVASLEELFDFGRDYLGLLKAAIIASGFIPPGMEGSGQSLEQVLETLIGPGLGFELVSHVNNIPKGSRLAVSTNLLAAMIGVCMRATKQTQSLEGSLVETERRLLLARSILGEWIGGSGGGWQDSGGVWPGIKTISGVCAKEGDIEHGLSRGRLMPQHHVLTEDEIPTHSRKALEDSLIIVHGGMASNVGPVLEMVTEKYLLRCEKETAARAQSLEYYERILTALRTGNMKELGAITSENFEGPIQTIIPWASNGFTETLIQRVKEKLGSHYWGFWMLGGISGGGMGFIVEPTQKKAALNQIHDIILAVKKELSSSLPFAMEPVVYDFAINEKGTRAELTSDHTICPSYYLFRLPSLLKKNHQDLSPCERSEIQKIAEACQHDQDYQKVSSQLIERLLPSSQNQKSDDQTHLTQLLQANGFDPSEHERTRQDLQSGKIGLSQNRLAANTLIEDVLAQDLLHEAAWKQQNEASETSHLGAKAIQEGQVAVLTLAAGAGSRWTDGAGIVKGIHPFCKFDGKHRSFLEVHLAKDQKTNTSYQGALPHIFTTSYLTHEAISEQLLKNKNYGYSGNIYLSKGQSIGLRMIPTERDLRFAWEQSAQQQLDGQEQKMLKSVREALIRWSKQSGEGSDYTANLPEQCIHPTGHWYEFPNLLLNGTLSQLLEDHSHVEYLMMHNIDTLGATVDPHLLGYFIKKQKTLMYEVIARQLDDRGGGLARVNGKAQLVEGMALPREEDELKLSYYNTGTNWIHIDSILETFELSRTTLHDTDAVREAIRKMASRMPTYITLKDVKRRWGRGQEDVFPVSQFERIWGDMTTICSTEYVHVNRRRGVQLKDQAALDDWKQFDYPHLIQHLQFNS